MQAAYYQLSALDIPGCEADPSLTWYQAGVQISESRRDGEDLQ